MDGKIKKNNEETDEEKKKRTSLSKMLRYYSIGTNFGYTLISPIIIMLFFYVIIEKFTHKKHPIILIIFLLLGIISGYWALYKQIKSVE